MAAARAAEDCAGRCVPIGRAPDLSAAARMAAAHAAAARDTRRRAGASRPRGRAPRPEASSERAAKSTSGAGAASMSAGATMAPTRPQPVPQPTAELRHDVGKTSAAT